MTKPDLADDENAGAGRRRVPRRTFRAPVGLLIAGTYTVERAYQLGEGGIMVDCQAQRLTEGTKLALSFFLPDGQIVMVRGVIRAPLAAKEGLPERYGIEFSNLGFHYKRAIRNFVAAATSENGQANYQSY